MDKAVDPFINTDEDPKIGDILYPPLDGGPDGIFFSYDIPRIWFNLF